MPVGEQQHVSVGVARASDDLVGARPDLLRGLPAGNAVGPQGPPRALDADVDGPPPFVLPVVPLQQVVGGLAPVGVTSQAAGVCSPGQGAREDERELTAGEPMAGELGLGTTFFGEGDVGAAGVTAEPGPLGLAVADENHLVLGHARSLPRARGRLRPVLQRALAVLAVVVGVTWLPTAAHAQTSVPGPGAFSIDPSSGLAGTS